MLYGADAHIGTMEALSLCSLSELTSLGIETALAERLQVLSRNIEMSSDFSELLVVKGIGSGRTYPSLHVVRHSCAFLRMQLCSDDVYDKATHGTHRP